MARILKLSNQEFKTPTVLYTNSANETADSMQEQMGNVSRDENPKEKQKYNCFKH